MVACAAGGHQRFAEARVSGRDSGANKRSRVLPGLQGKGHVRQRKHFCCLDFLLLFHQGKSNRSCGKLPIIKHTYLPMGLPRRPIAQPNAAPRNDNSFKSNEA
jgi:hypothetical protein